jgi:hypothetical protein
MSEINPDDLVVALRLLYVGELFAILAVSISKTSFAVTLLRLTTNTWQRYLLWYIIASLNLIMGLCGLFTFIQCSPVDKLWNLSTPGTCWEPTVQIRYAIFAGCKYRRVCFLCHRSSQNNLLYREINTLVPILAYSAAMDFLLAVIPWVMMWKIQMKRREKLGIAVAMSLGVL